MRYLVEDNDDNNGNRIFDTLAECGDYMEEQASWRGFPLEEANAAYSVYEIGASVSFTARPATIILGEGANIPAPLPGETVTAYAWRITGA